MQTSILHGSPSCCSSNEVGSDVKMVSDTRDEDLSLMATGFGMRGLSPSSSATSIAMLLAIGRFESTRFKRFLANNLSSARDLGQAQFDNVVSAAKSLQTKLDKMIARMPTQGIAETGFIPSRLATASPLTHEWLYSDRTDQATIWNSWAKNMLIMLKTEVAILVQKPFLARGDSKSKQQQRLWNRCVGVPYQLNYYHRILYPCFVFRLRYNSLQITFFYCRIADARGEQCSPTMCHTSSQFCAARADPGICALFMVLQKFSDPSSASIYYSDILATQ